MSSFGGQVFHDVSAGSEWLQPRLELEQERGQTYSELTKRNNWKVSGEKDDTIDYFIVSEELKDCIIAFEMQGHRIDLEGFYGSDHCPVSLEISEASSEEG